MGKDQVLVTSEVSGYFQNSKCICPLMFAATCFQKPKSTHSFFQKMHANLVEGKIPHTQKIVLYKKTNYLCDYGTGCTFNKYS